MKSFLTILLFLVGHALYAQIYYQNAPCDSLQQDSCFVYTNIDSIVCENAYPFIWQSNYISKPGEYQAYYKTPVGCDSIVSIRILSNVVEEEFKLLTLSNESFPYLFDGILFQNALDTTLVYTTKYGCDSILYLSFINDEQSIFVLDTFICENLFPIKIRGRELFNSTTFRQKDTLWRIHKKEQNVKNIHKFLCPNISLNFKGEVYNKPGDYFIASHSCDDMIHLSLDYYSKVKFNVVNFPMEVSSDEILPLPVMHYTADTVIDSYWELSYNRDFNNSRILRMDSVMGFDYDFYLRYNVETKCTVEHSDIYSIKVIHDSQVKSYIPDLDSLDIINKGILEVIPNPAKAYQQISIIIDSSIYNTNSKVSIFSENGKHVTKITNPGKMSKMTLPHGNYIICYYIKDELIATSKLIVI